LTWRIDIKNKNNDKCKNEGKNSEQKNYMTLGMSFGILAGAVAMAILSMFGHILWGGVCVSIGMLLGMVIGMSIPKN
jgi:hypothetical protein